MVAGVAGRAAMMPFRREWGTGPPVIAMHPLGLESSAFEGVGQALARHGLRTIAVDLPGFGRTPAPGGPLTPAALAAPIVALARSLDQRPVVLGISLGGRIALEAALTAPDAFRAVVPIAPYLPWRRFRPLLELMRFVDPRLAAALPLEWVWPVLSWLAQTVETIPALRDDAVARSGARLVYYLSCPATRAAFLSAGRELALDPATGPDGFWPRLAGLAVPAAFVWCEQDQLVSLAFARTVARTRPDVAQLLLPCAGHWLNGPHHRCLADALGGIVTGLLAGRPPGTPAPHPGGAAFVARACVVDARVDAPAVLVRA